MNRVDKLLNIINAEIEEPLSSADHTLIDSVINEIDCFLLNGDFDIIDKALVKSNVEIMPPQIILAILTATHAASNKLSSRDEFLKRARSALMRICNDEQRVDRLLRFL